MTCPWCSTPLEYRTAEEVTEIARGGNFPDYTTTSWHAYRCPSCRRDTGPRGAKFIARQEAREWGSK
jgi:uncharacterized protein with PIN domain